MPKGCFSARPTLDTATEFYFEAIYANGVKLIVSSEERGGVTLEGSDGWVWATPAPMTRIPSQSLDSVIGPAEIHLYRSDNHFRNFSDCVISRKGRTCWFTARRPT